MGKWGVAVRCPECGHEMEEGLLQGVQRVAWVRKRHRLSLWPKKGEILLANNPFQDFVFPAWICKDCKKIIMEYGDKEIREG